MRYPASEKLEIIHIVERSHLLVKATLDKLGVSRLTFYRWYDLYQRFGETGLEDKRSGPNQAWNCVPQVSHEEILSAKPVFCILSDCLPMPRQWQ